jgi:hypothetical protein
MDIARYSTDSLLNSSSWESSIRHDLLQGIRAPLPPSPRPPMVSFSSSSPTNTTRGESFSPSCGSIPAMLRFIYMKKISHEKYLVDSLSFKEKQALIPYAKHLETCLVSTEFMTSIKLQSVIEAAKFSLQALGRDTPPSHSFVIVLLMLLKTVTPASCLKYQTMEDFFVAYPDFQNRNDKEKNYLHETANWMHLLFQFIPAKVPFSVPLLLLL